MPFLSARDTSNWATTKEDYIAGAQAEAVRGREQMVSFAEWLNSRYYKAIEEGYYSKLPKIYAEVSKAYPITMLLDLFLDTQKKKG